MTTIFAALVGFLCITGVMSIGVLLGKSPLKGSCGGKGGPECICDAFEQQKCKARERMMAAKAERT